MGDIDMCLDLADETAGLLQNSNNQLDCFLMRRANNLLDDFVHQEYCLLLGYELLYLWNALTAVSAHHKSVILEECRDMINIPLSGLRHLVMGVILCDMANFEEGMHHLREAVESAASGDEDTHVAAFASYELGAALTKAKEAALKNVDKSTDR